MAGNVCACLPVLGSRFSHSWSGRSMRLSCRGGFGLSLYICKTWTAMRNFRYYFLTRNLIDTGLAAYDTSVRLLHAFKAFAFGLRVDSWFQWVPL